MADGVIDSLSIEIGASSKTAVDNIKKITEAMGKLKTAVNGIKMDGLVGEFGKINGQDVNKISKLAYNLERLGKVKIGASAVSDKIANRVADIAAACDLLEDRHVETLANFGTALQTFSGKVSISKDIADRMLDIGFAMEQITDESIERLGRMTVALSKLKDVNLTGVGSAMKAVRSSGNKQAVMAKAAQPEQIAVSGAVATVTEFKSNIQNAREMMDAISPGLADLSDKFDQFGARVIRVFDRIDERVKGVKKTLNAGKGMNWNFSWSNNLKNIKEYWQGVGNAVSKFFTPGLNVAISLVGKLASGVLNVAKGIAKWVFHTAIDALKKVWSLMQRIAKTAVRVGGDMFKGMAKYVTEVGKGVANISRNLARFMWAHSPIKKLTDSFANLKKVVSSLGRVAFYRLVRSAIKAVKDSLQEGSENAYWFSRKFGESTKYISERLDELSTANFKMKNQVGAAWATLLATIEPILLRLLELVTKAASVVTQFFGAMGGKSTYLKAKSYPQEWAEDAEEAAEKTKEWKNQLMGFDTLNRLNEQNDSDSGIDEKIKDYSEMFEEVSIDPWITDLSELLKQLDELNLDKWFQVGIKLADNLNDLMKKFDDWILKITPDLKNAAKNLASLLNGLIEGTDWELLGKTVGDGLNAIFGAIDEFLTSVKWKELGRGLGTALKSMIDTVDWKLVGKTFADAWNAFMYVIEGIVTTPGLWKSIGKAFGKMVRSFIDNIDIDSMATSVIAIMNGVTEAIENFLAQDPFENLAPKLTNAIERIINEVEWGYIGEQFGKLFQSILDVINDVIMETDWKAFGTSIGTSIRNFLAEIDAGELGQTLVGVITSALDFVYGMITTPGFTAQLATSLHDFFIGALGQFEEWLKGVEPTDVANAIRDFFNNLKADEIKDSFVRVVKLAWEKAMAVKEELFPEGLIVTVTKHIVDFFNSADWEKIKTTITENVKKAWTAALEIIDAIWPPEKRGEFIDKLKTKFSEVFRKAIDSVDWQAIHNVFAYLLDCIIFGKEKATSIWYKKGEFVGRDLIIGTEYSIQQQSAELERTMQSYIVNPVSEALYQMEQDAKRSSSNTSQRIGNAVKSVSGSMNTMRSSVVSSTNGINSNLNRVISISKNVSSAMQNMQSRSSSSIRSMSSGVNSAANSIVSGLNRIISKANQAFSATSRIGKINISSGRAYASGGFPEEGPFYMNQGEIVGRFSNGQTAIANSDMITEGIAEAVYGAFVRAFADTGGGGNGGPHVAILQVNGREFARATYDDQKAVASEKGISLISNFA